MRASDYPPEEWGLVVSLWRAPEPPELGSLPRLVVNERGMRRRVQGCAMAGLAEHGTRANHAPDARLTPLRLAACVRYALFDEPVPKTHELFAVCASTKELRRNRPFDGIDQQSRVARLARKTEGDRAEKRAACDCTLARCSPVRP